MSELNDYLVIAWSVLRLVGRIVLYFALVPVFILGCLFVLPIMAARLIYLMIGITLTLRHKPARDYFNKQIHGEESTDMGGVDVRMANGFNVDLERDFVGTPQVRG